MMNCYMSAKYEGGSMHEMPSIICQVAIKRGRLLQPLPIIDS